MHPDEYDQEYRLETRLNTDGDDLKDEEDEAIPQISTEQPADEPRGEEEVRRELGPGDGDDPPPHQDDEPLPR